MYGEIVKMLALTGGKGGCLHSTLEGEGEVKKFIMKFCTSLLDRYDTF